MDAALIAIILKYSTIYEVDPYVALSVARVESGLNPNAIGSNGEIGIFQLKPTSVPHVKATDLFNPEINIKTGIAFLSWNKKHCKHKENTLWLNCYNMGVGSAQGIKDPYATPYYKKVKKEMKKFEEGQKVMIANLHGNTLDGEAIYLGLARDVYHNKGYHRVLNEYDVVMLVEASRIVHYDQYWNDKKNCLH